MQRTPKQWLQWRPITISDVRPVIPLTHVNKNNKRFVFPSTIVTVPGGWSDASYIIARAKLTLTYPYAFQLPIIRPNDTFCATVRWVENTTTVLRYKLWEDVGEKLTFPLYSGEVVPIGTSWIEIWNVQGDNTAYIQEADGSGWELVLTELEVPEFCCSAATTGFSLTDICVTDSNFNPTDISQYFTKCI